LTESQAWKRLGSAGKKSIAQSSPVGVQSGQKKDFYQEGEIGLQTLFQKRKGENTLKRYGDKLHSLKRRTAGCLSMNSFRVW
jgi:hypothetical protein